MTGQARRQVGLMVLGLFALVASTAYTNHQAQVVRARQIVDAGEIKALLRAHPPARPAGSP